MRAASAGSHTRTSTAKTTRRMPDASGIRPARLGLTAKVFLAATLLVVVVLGVTFGLTSLQAHRTADESIRRALVGRRDRKSTRLNSSHITISYAVFCLKKKTVRIGPLVPAGAPSRLHW